jgi:hypothetical protein
MESNSFFVDVKKEFLIVLKYCCVFSVAGNFDEFKVRHSWRVFNDGALFTRVHIRLVLIPHQMRVVNHWVGDFVAPPQ